MQNATAQTPQPARLESLTGLRWWAAFGVFIFHMRVFAPLPGLGGLASIGDYGVMFFFVLSGFVLTISATRGTTSATFYWRRFSRIWPANFVALLLAIPVFYSFDPNPDQPWVKMVSIPILLLSVPIIQGWWRDPNILFSGNPASWTLTCEFFFYSLHPGINGVLRRANLRWLLIVGVAVFALIITYNTSNVMTPGAWTNAIPTPIARLGEFVLGMVVAAAVRRGYLTKVPSWAGFVVVGVFAAALAVVKTFTLQSPIARFLADFSPSIMVLLFCLLIGVVAARDSRGQKSVLRWRPLVILGEWSFAFYLVHATCIYFVRDFVGQRPASWSNLVWYAGLLVISLAVAGALHLLVEKPLERRLRGWWAMRQAIKATA